MGSFTDLLKEMISNDEFPRSVKFSLEKYLEKASNREDELKSLVLEILEQASNDPNIHPASRTQLWSAISVIEDFNK